MIPLIQPMLELHDNRFGLQRLTDLGNTASAFKHL